MRTAKAKTKRASKKSIDPRLTHAIDQLEQATAYGAEHGGNVSPDRAVIEMVLACLEFGVESERQHEILKLLWEDNDHEQFSDVEDRRDAIVEIAETLHREHCECCAKKAAAMKEAA